MREIIDHINTNYTGLSEVYGSASDPQILDWIQDLIPYAQDDSKIAWCSIFVYQMLKEMNIEAPPYTAARQWLNFGFETKDPQYGDIVVFWRGSKSDWRGHVAFYIREIKDKVLVLGGNQDNSVSYKWYAKSRILGFRKINLL